LGVNLPHRQIALTVSILVSVLSNLPKLVLAFAADTPPLENGNLAYQMMSSFLFSYLAFWLCSLKYLQKTTRILVFLLVLLAFTVVCVQFHHVLFASRELRTGIRVGFYFRHLLILITVLLTTQYWQSNQEKQRLLLQLKNLEAENLKAQLKLLQEQLNPHFLFNSLNTLHSLIRENPAKGQQFVSHLSSIFRYSLSAHQHPLIGFVEEWKMLDAYLYLLKLRFEDKIQFRFEHTEQVKGFLPPLSLQLLVENAIVHNEISTKSPLLVCIAYQEATKSLSVSNSLNPKRNPTSGAGLGLLNLKNRFELLGANPIQIIKTETEFTVILPVLVHENTPD
jgi:two-component system, LytTR family, sensor kinase